MAKVKAVEVTVSGKIAWNGITVEHVEAGDLILDPNKCAQLLNAKMARVYTPGSIEPDDSKKSDDSKDSKKPDDSKKTNGSKEKGKSGVATFGKVL